MKTNQNRLKRVWRNQRGGIGTIIATVVTIILVLGLIAYAVLSQVAGVKDTGDKAEIEQNKISMMLKNPNIVTGNTVKNYARQAGDDLTVKISIKGAADIMIDEDSENDIELDDVKDNALYSMEKTYNANGELEEVDFDQVDLSK